MILLAQPRTPLALTALGQAGAPRAPRVQRHVVCGCNGATQGALRVCPDHLRRAPPMRPSPSLHYVSTLLAQRRRRHHRARRLWGTSLTLLGLGLLLVGWWVTLRYPGSPHTGDAPGRGARAVRRGDRDTRAPAGAPLGASRPPGAWGASGPPLPDAAALARGVHARRRLRSRVLPAAPAGGGGALRPQAPRTARERGPPPAAPRLSRLRGHTLSHGPRRATSGARARPAAQETAASGPAAGEARPPPEARV
jgi:hypothetical protein